MAEVLTAPLVVSRRLPADLGGRRISVSTKAGLRYLFRGLHDVDPELLGLARRYVQPGDSVWDVGANLGLFSFAAAGRSGPGGFILAVEPDACMAGLMRRTLRRPHAGSAMVQVLAAAISDQVGVGQLCIAQRSRASNFLDGHGGTQTGGVIESHCVATLTLDALAEFVPLPKVLKIDVEGAELRVLRGASRVLAEVRPIILCEVGHESSPGVTELLLANGYRLYDGSCRASGNTEVQSAPWNTVAIPR